MDIFYILKLEQPPARVLELLYEQGFDAVKWRTGNGKSVVHLAIHAGRFKLVKVLLEEGCDANTTDSEGLTPLGLACEKGRLDMAKVLVGHGADIHTATFHMTVSMAEGGQASNLAIECITALASALMCGHDEVVTFLLEQGARANCTALAAALMLGTATVKKLLAAGTEGSFDTEFYRLNILKAALEGKGEILGVLLKAGPQFFSAQLQEQALVEAIKAQQLPVVRAMYDAGWRLADKDYGDWMLCAAQGTDILEYLLFTVGCDPNGTLMVIGDEGMAQTTILHESCGHGNLEHLSVLIWAGADLDAPDSFGITPMAYALHGGSRYPQLMCRYLRQCGVDPTCVPITAQQRAVLRGVRQRLLQEQAREVREGRAPPQLTKEQQEQEFQRVVCEIKRRVRARVKARCRSPPDFYPLLCAVRSEPAPLVSQTAVDRSIDRFYSQRDTPAQLSQVQVVTRDAVVAADGCVYERAAIESWIEECLRAWPKILDVKMPAYQARYHQYTPKQRPSVIEVSTSSYESSPQQHSPLVAVPLTTSPSPKSRESSSHCPPSGLTEDCLPPSECRPTHPLYYSPPSLFIIPEDNEATDYPAQERVHRFRWPTSGYRRAVHSTVTKDYKWNEQHQRVGSLGTRSIIGEVSITKNVTVTTTTHMTRTGVCSNGPSTATYHRAVRSTLTKDFTWNEQHQRVGSLGTRSIIGEVSVLSSMWGKNNERAKSSVWGLGRRSPLVGRATA